MKRLLCSSALLVLMTLASGCTIYFGDDTGDDCYYLDEPDYWLGYRNPVTGVCEDWGGGGGGGCYDYDDEPQPGGAEADAVPLPDWASCPGACEGLDEATCLDTAGCRGAYYQEECPPDVDCDAFFEQYFMECWGVAPTGPIYGACEGLDAQTCSMHDDCIAVYTEDWNTGGQIFSYCAAEPGVFPGCEAVDCGPGYHCELQCYPDGLCEPTCVPDAPWCDDGTTCPEGSHCETWCTGGGDCFPGMDCPPKECWSECVPDVPDPVTCDGPVFCDSLPPTCPDGSVPGIQNGCWTGTCIPVEECGGPGPVCESLATEAECVNRPDCLAVYDGFGCTCYPDGTCTCEELVYTHCESGGFIDPDPMPL